MSNAKWNVTTLERTTLDGSVYTIHWNVSLIDAEYSASAYGTTGLPPADLENFIPYEELSRELVIDWLKNIMGEEQVNAYESSLVRQIEEQRNPTKATGIPW